MRLWLAFLTLPPMLTACGFGANGDGGKDAGPVPPDAQQCFGSIVKVCFDHAAHVPTAPVTLPSGSNIPVNTDSSTLCDVNTDRSDHYCVIAGSGFTLPTGQSIRGYGSKPLILLSTGVMDIEGSVDVSSNSSTGDINKGANASPSTCALGTPAAGASGGYGGTFIGKGGTGELIGISLPGVPPDPQAGAPTSLHGGCPGGAGGNGGAGGEGGGAVALVASSTITIGAAINASGSGGHGGQAGGSRGAGGGGSGGMIVIDAGAPISVTTGTFIANGGGGGEGGSMGSVGHDGQTSTVPTPSALGGSGGGIGGNGGAGSSGSGEQGGDNAAGQSSGDGGGGGGGGGAGFIYAPNVTGDSTISPPTSPLNSTL